MQAMPFSLENYEKWRAFGAETVRCTVCTAEILVIFDPGIWYLKIKTRPKSCGNLIPQVVLIPI